MTERDLVRIGDVPVDRLTSAQWTALLVADWRRKKRMGAPPKVVTTANGQVIALFAQDKTYREAVLAADHVAADGMSVVFASQLASDKPLPERVATTDWFHAVAKAASRHGIRFYMLGATAEANSRALRRIWQLYPYIRIAGARDGYFAREDITRVADEIAQSDADVLWIGMGNPQQVILAHEFKKLVPGLTWIRTCGGLFDFLSGDRARAPVAMQKAGLEWVFRMAQEPRRLGWRYATTNMQAVYAMAAHSRDGVQERRPH